MKIKKKCSIIIQNFAEESTLSLLTIKYTMARAKDEPITSKVYRPASSIL